MLSTAIYPPVPAVAEDTVLVNVMPQETKIAVLTAACLRDFQLERNIKATLVGNIYLGKVGRVIPGLQSAFIDIGVPRAAFLNFADLVENKINPDKPCRIESVLREGQTVLVQAVKEPVGNKGARVTTQISLLGRYLVFLPQDRHIGISQKISDEQVRSLLKMRLEAILTAGHSGGFIIRTEAQTAEPGALAREITFLQERWAQIQAQSRTAAPPVLIYQDLNLPLRLLRDLNAAHTLVIEVNDRPTYEAMRRFAAAYCPDLTLKINYFTENNLWAAYGVDKLLHKALSPRVELPGGGYLIIESTEAMTTVDVNTGTYLGGNDFQETIVETNLQAATVIARELALRHIGGIIIIDFIDMVFPEHREAVLAALTTALARDKTKSTVNGFTALGLVELTRKRSRHSLKNLLTEKCSCCQGYGFVKATSTVCYEILQFIYNQVKEYGYNQVKVIAAAEVTAALTDVAAPALKKLREDLNIAVTVGVNQDFARDYFEFYPE